jgi:ABC-type Fe3+ transport system permease subunit
MLDKGKLPSDAWVRRLWLPADSSDASERPIVLIINRRRFWIAVTAMLIAALVAILLSILHAFIAAPLAVLFTLVIIWLSARGRVSGFYEVKKDGSLGEYLGGSTPIGLGSMRQTKP